jgi:hypothetical protein
MPRSSRDQGDAQMMELAMTETIQQERGVCLKLLRLGQVAGCWGLHAVLTWGENRRAKGIRLQKMLKNV